MAIPFNYSYWSLAFTNELMDEHASKGAFNNYVDRILSFFDPHHALTVFIPWARTKIDIFWPLPPHLVHVVIEWPLTKWMGVKYNFCCFTKPIRYVSKMQVHHGTIWDTTLDLSKHEKSSQTSFSPPNWQKRGFAP